MELYVYEGSLKGVIDLYESLIWTKRYREGGEFELYLPMNVEVFELLKPYRKIKRLDDDTTMVIEKIKITTDEEKGDYLLVTGRSLEGMLQKTVLYDSFNSYFTSPANDTLFNYVKNMFIRSSGYPFQITDILYDKNSRFMTKVVNFSFQNDITNCYDIITQLCVFFDMGYRIFDSSINGVDYPNNLIFYEGKNRSINQSTNNHVIFSSEYDNLISSEYEYDTTNEAHVAKVNGGIIKTSSTTNNFLETTIELEKPSIFYYSGGGISVDATQTVDHDKIYTSSEQESEKQNLTSIGRMQLGRHKAKEIFEANIDVERTFKYKKDFFIGDIVTIQNRYGISRDVRIIEITEVDDINGYKLVPVLEEVKV